MIIMVERGVQDGICVLVDGHVHKGRPGSAVSHCG